MEQLLIASGAFVLAHLLMSHSLRGAMVAMLGEKIFLGVYSLVSLALMIWMVIAFRAAPRGETLWSAGDVIWALASALMWAGSVLFVGAMHANPATPSPGVRPPLDRPAWGVFGITRHPMMWSFALWALVHILVMPAPRQIVLAVAIALLALGGAAGQDRKKRHLLGAGWRAWEARTAYMPFGAQLSGRAAWSNALPSGGVLAFGTALWLTITYAHGTLGAGIWRWVG